jgi:serine/threonine-protein kinase HipA
MNICPITYKECGNDLYSEEGLKLLSKDLDSIKLFPYTQPEQIREALTNVSSLNLPGTSPKLTANINIKTKCFEIAVTNGRFILKPQNTLYTQIPENEDLTMRLAGAVGIDVPLHGLIYCKDNSMSYFIKRFDRGPKKSKYYTEDFAQLSNKSRDEKYNSSMEEISGIIDKYCTFPILEKIKLLRITIFNYLTGNSESHLKKYSVINRSDKIELSPFYDLVNTDIIYGENDIEIALPLNSKRKNLNYNDLIKYYAKNILTLNDKVIFEILKSFENVIPVWLELIQKSFLKDELKEKYFKLLEKRIVKFFKT